MKNQLLQKLFFSHHSKKDGSNRLKRMVVPCALQWDGMTRLYYVYSPTKLDMEKPKPLYIGLHAFTEKAADFVKGSLIPYACDLFGGIMAFPQGGEFHGMTGWNAGMQHFQSGKCYSLYHQYDDVGFINCMIDNLIPQYNIDRNRIFVFGFSMGGFMANRLAIECGNRFRAICSANGTIGTMIWDKKPKSLVNFLHIHGTSDSVVPYEVNPEKQSKSHGIGAEQLVEYWRIANQCNSEPLIFDYPHITDSNITFQIKEYSGGTYGVKTAFIKATNGMHTWYDWFKHDISYSTEIMRFFASAPLLTEKDN